MSSFPITLCTEKNPDVRTSSLGDKSGFTLLELLVVMVIGVLFISLSIPQLRSNLLVSELDRSTLLVAQMIDRMKLDAQLSEHGCLMEISISEGKLSYYCNGGRQGVSHRDEKDGSRLQLPSSVQISSIWYGYQQMNGENSVSLWVNPRGRMNHTIINFDDGKNASSLISKVFSMSSLVYPKKSRPSDHFSLLTGS
ncbi:MAG: type II secretion system protein [Desulfobulbaceae bacterium]|nr:MAG: type II secretion system protein [Desulfobulbaceae bacterium]